MHLNVPEILGLESLYFFEALNDETQRWELAWPIAENDIS